MFLQLLKLLDCLSLPRLGHKVGVHKVNPSLNNYCLASIKMVHILRKIQTFPISAGC